MVARFLLTTLAFTGILLTLFFALNLLTLALLVVFFTEAGEPGFVETYVVPALSSITVMLSLPGELLLEKFRFAGPLSAFNPLLKQAALLLSSLLWALPCSLGWAWLYRRPLNFSGRAA